MMKKIFTKDNIKRYVIMSFALLFAAGSFNLFLRQTKIVAGGINGIGILGEKLISIDASIIVLIFSAILLLLSHFFLDKKNTVAGLYATFFYPFSIFITGFLKNMFSIPSNAYIIIAIFAGIINGITNGIIFKLGLNNGGLGIVSKIIDKNRKIDLARINFILNILVVIAGMFVFKLVNALYAFIYLYISALFTKVILKKE